MYNEAEMADTFLTTISGITQSIKKEPNHIQKLENIKVKTSIDYHPLIFF